MNVQIVLGNRIISLKKREGERLAKKMLKIEGLNPRYGEALNMLYTIGKYPIVYEGFLYFDGSRQNLTNFQLQMFKTFTKKVSVKKLRILPNKAIIKGDGSVLLPKSEHDSLEALAKKELGYSLYDLLMSFRLLVIDGKSVVTTEALTFKQLQRMDEYKKAGFSLIHPLNYFK